MTNRSDPTGWKARPRWRFTRADTIALGPGKADLLEAIDREGSISAAALSMGMSYRRAWMLVRTMNDSFRRPLVDTPGRGRWQGRGSHLTATGRKTLRLYRRLQAQSLRATQETRRELTRILTP